jgi:hypothetical protein
MRPRTELAIGVAAFSALVLLAGVAGRRERNTGNQDARASSLLDGPRGLKGLSDVIAATGGVASASRARFGELLERAADSVTIVIANPPRELSADEITEFFAARPDAVLAGLGTDRVMTCAGFEVSGMVLDSTRVRVAGDPVPSDVWSHAVLEQVPESLQVLRRAFGERMPCPEIALTRVDTLLVDEEGDAVAIRAWFGTRPTRLLILADERLLANATLRRTRLAPRLVAWVSGLNRRVAFDEFHQGFGPEGSLWAVTLAWSRASPEGWMLWQLALVGAIAFFAGAVRFGPIVPAIPRQRRSSREHVTALATALASARGHDVAIASIVRGLQRRLRAQPRDGRGGRSDGRPAAWGSWVRGLAESASSPHVRAGAIRLQEFSVPNQSNAAVRASAHVVEDLWEALHH